MDPEIIAAIIGGIAVILAAFIGVGFFNRKKKAETTETTQPGIKADGVKSDGDFEARDGTGRGVAVKDLHAAGDIKLSNDSPKP